MEATIKNITKTKKVYFLHIPKTAGTTIYTYLDKFFDQNEIFPYVTWHQLSSDTKSFFSLNELKMGKYNFVRGHFGSNKDFVNNRFVFTFLRDPSVRTVSHIQHIYNSPELKEWAQENFKFEKDDILSPILNPHFARYVSNLQTKYLLCEIDLYKDLYSMTNKNLIFFEQHPDFIKLTEQSSKIVYLKTINKLRKLNFIGLQEYFEESLLMLSDQLGITFNKEFKNFRENKVRSENYPITKEYKELLYSLNIHDTLLYNIGKRLFIMKWLKFIKRKLDIHTDLQGYLLRRDEILSKF